MRKGKKGENYLIRFPVQIYQTFWQGSSAPETWEELAHPPKYDLSASRTP
jgi:hypothetical protein